MTTAVSKAIAPSLLDDLLRYFDDLRADADMVRQAPVGVEVGMQSGTY